MAWAPKIEIMGKYKIEAKKVLTVTDTIAASSLDVAIATFKNNYEGFSIEAIDDKEVIGFDEGTEEPIFEGDDYHYDEDGCYTLAKNLPPLDAMPAGE